MRSWMPLRLGLVLGLSACSLHLEPSCGVHGHAGDVAAPPPAPATELASCPGRARTGITECFANPCGPGLYCDETTLRECRPGCTSDANCGPRDICVREGTAALGRCESCGGHERHAAAPGCVEPSRTGATPCFFGDCGAGQFCGSEARCVPGCVSDENCSAEEHCAREPGSVLGVCRSCYF